jgi:signal peptidase I
VQWEPPGTVGATPENPAHSPPKRPARWALRILVAFAVLVGGCATFVGVNTRIRETAIALSKGATHNYVAASDAMAPSMPQGANFMTTSKVGKVHRGDVVTFTAPANVNLGSMTLIKRVIGLPGEVFEMRGGKVYIDGQPIAEPYLEPGTQTTCFGGAGQCAPERLADDQYYVLGDARGASRDSRGFGPISRSSMTGVVVRITSPPSKAGPVPGSSR